VKLVPIVDDAGATLGWIFWCAGCDHPHWFPTSGAVSAVTWDFNGSRERPTFSPSLKNTWNEGPARVPKCCHLFLTDGRVEYCADSTHALAGKTIDLPDLPEE
jgi:hypothetical protein